MQVGKTTHGLDGQHQDVDRTEIHGESTSIVWPTLGSRTTKEQNRYSLRRSIVMSVCVCVFVCDHIFGTTRPIDTIYNVSTATAFLGFLQRFYGAVDGAGFKEWSIVQLPTRPLPYGPRSPMMIINKKICITAAKTGFLLRQTL